MLELIDRFTQLLLAPFTNHSMIWIVVPLIIALFLMTIYFAKYRSEELGWNTALGNSLVLIFVSINLYQTTFNTNQSTAAFVLATLLLLFGFLLLLVNFTHFLPRKIGYLLSSPLSINLIAYVSIAIIYSDLPIDLLTIFSALMLLAALFFTFLALGLVSKKWWTTIEKMKSTEDIEDVKKVKSVLDTKKKEIKVEEKKIQETVKKREVEVKNRQKELKKIKKVVKKVVKRPVVKRKKKSKPRKKSKTIKKPKNKK